MSTDEAVDRDYDLRGEDDADDEGQTADAAATDDPGDETEAGDEFGRRGWLLVGAVVVATLVLPAVVYLYPTLLADRVPFLVAMLVVPFLPAALLGATAVWSMSESARSEPTRSE